MISIQDSHLPILVWIPNRAKSIYNFLILKIMNPPEFN